MILTIQTGEPCPNVFVSKLRMTTVRCYSFDLRSPPQRPANAEWFNNIRIISSAPPWLWNAQCATTTNSAIFSLFDS